MSGEVTPVGAERFAQLVEKFSDLSSPIAVAVSGGPDSMALAFCLKRWGRREMIALIVEHGLRTESADEAEATKKRLEALGIAADILRWEHGNMTGGIQQKARDARYALLIEACHRHKAKDLFTAHQRDDQAETILMRIAKGSGIEGLAGIRSEKLRGDIRILRPFLTISKAQLIATCDEAGISYVNDPGNVSEKFARGRLRGIMPLLEKEGMTQETILRLGAHAAEADSALWHYAGQYLLRAAQFGPGGSIHIDRLRLGEIPDAVALRALSAILRALHEDGYPPEYDGLRHLLHFLIAKEDGTRSYHNCLISAAAGDVTVMREPAAVREILTLNPGREILWDGRWLVSSAAQAPAAEIRALGNPPHEVIDPLAPKLRHLIPQGRIRASLPGLWRGEALFAIPSLDQTGPFRMRLKKQSFA